MHEPSGGSSEARLPPGFPKGLRVLVVDDDSLCLKVVEQMLRKCDYTATTCINGSSALQLLRERPTDFDLVLSDVYMPDMDGFKLLEMVGLEMDLPVIMMSSNGETSTVLRGVTHGAVDFLIKPVRIEELRNVWQHVIRRRRELVKDFDSEEHSQEVKEEAPESGRKRKDLGSSLGDMERVGADDETNASKKPRVTWSVEMHQKFVGAVNSLGVDKAVPKKILEIMNVDGLTRENVASHLQKYRLYLKRVQGAPQQQVPRNGKATAHTSGAGQAPGPGSNSGAGAAAAQQPPTPNGHPPAGGGAAAGSTGGGAGHLGTAGSSHAMNGSMAPGTAAAAAAGMLGATSPSPGLPTGPAGMVGMQGPAGNGDGMGHAGGPMSGFPGLLGPNNPMGLNPLLGMNPLGQMNHLGMAGPLGLPSMPGPLGMLPGMGAGLGMPGLPGSLPGMGMSPLGFMPGMPPMAPPMGMPNGMMNPGLMPPNMGMAMGQQAMQNSMHSMQNGFNGLSVGGPQDHTMNGSMGGGQGLNPGSGPGGVTDMSGGLQQPGMGGGPTASESVLPLELTELGIGGEPLADLLQGEAGSGGELGGLLQMDVGDMEGGFSDLAGSVGNLHDSLAGSDGKDQAMDELLNYFLKS